MEQLRGLARQTHGILARYITVHDALYKFSLRHIIPIPGMFKAIDFGSHYRTLTALCSELEDVLAQVGGLEPSTETQEEFREALEKYAAALLETVVKLREICGRLYQKSQTVGGFRFIPRDAEYQDYYASIKRYQNVGERLNALFHVASGKLN